MRTAALLLVTGALVSACGTEEPASPATQPKVAAERDLTTRALAMPPVEVASAVELADPRPQPARVARPSPRPKPVPRPAPVAAPASPVVLPTQPIVVPPPVDSAPAPVDAPEAAVGSGRELAPGQTVTIVPVSSGPTVETDADDSWLPSERPRSIIGGNGGTCRPRGGVRGIGVAGRIPVGVPTRRLR